MSSISRTGTANSHLNSLNTKKKKNTAYDVGNPVSWLGRGTTMLWGKTVVKGSVVLRSEASPNKNLEKPSRQLFTCTCKTKTNY